MRLLPCLLALLTAFPALISAAEPEPPQFTRDIRPILLGRCAKCHGVDEETRESGLRFDRRESATTELDSGAIAIVPGKPDESEVIARVTADDEFTRMPPPGSGEPLTPAEVDTLRRWIAAGAE